MRHNRDEKRFGRRTEHLKSMLNNMAASLFTHDRIVTTFPKAKEVRRVAERLITLGKEGSIHARRRAFAVLQDRSLVKKLFDEIAPRYKDRNGGYTRIVKAGTRRGDAAPLSLIELVEEKIPVKKKKSFKGRARKIEKTAKPDKSSGTEGVKEKVDVKREGTSEEKT